MGEIGLPSRERGRWPTARMGLGSPSKHSARLPRKMPRLLFDEPLSEELNRLALLRGAPPKFVWIRLGNCTTDDIAQLLRDRHNDIIRFNEQNEATVLELG